MEGNTEAQAGRETGLGKWQDGRLGEIMKGGRGTEGGIEARGE